MCRACIHGKYGSILGQRQACNDVYMESMGPYLGSVRHVYMKSMGPYLGSVRHVMMYTWKVWVHTWAASGMYLSLIHI